MIKLMFGLNSKIGRRLILYTLLFSSMTTIIVTMFYLYRESDRDLKLTQKVFKQIELSDKDSIINSLWVTDDELLLIQLEEILMMPNVQFAEVRKGREVIKAAGDPGFEEVTEHTIPLVYPYNGQEVFLGDLHIVASRENFYKRAIDVVLESFMVRVIEIFAIAFFLFIMFYYLVGRHIVFMASFIESMNFKSMDKPLILDREIEGMGHDEIDQLVTSFNRMRENLRLDIVQEKLVEQKLQKSEEKFKSVFHQADVGMARVGINGTWLEVNKKLCDIVGYQQDELMLKTFQDITHPDDFRSYHQEAD